MRWKAFGWGVAAGSWVLARGVLMAVAGMAVVLGCSSRGVACLRDSLDDRAVEWSSEIVLANLSVVNQPQAMGTSDNIQYQTYDFEITASVDGPGKVGEKITVVRFMLDSDSQKSSICGQTLSDRQVGKSFLLLLRPEAEVAWSDREGADPRPAALHALKAFVVVHLESVHDLGTEGLEDAKYTISSTRAAEAQFKAEDAKLQAQTMIDAADDTEESQAQHALEEMGYKAAPVLKALLAQADGEARGRLERVIRAVSPPSLTAGAHVH